MIGFKIPRVSDPSNVVDRSKSYNPFGQVLMPELVRSTSLMVTGPQMIRKENYDHNLVSPVATVSTQTNNEEIAGSQDPEKKSYSVPKPQSLLTINPFEIRRMGKISCHRCSGPHKVKFCTKPRLVKYPTKTYNPMNSDWQ
ncbi:unnamed protein product [Allacma fusca]|uniref:Uncharacterized protein n=1 Tax=Allacma fusca TaxID=39272 RepID=A0A8J2JLI2_9HEXA|nr:unnamed protein product [Allacma fusca]